MKDMEQLEELLNGYIDGELDERKSNEVKRLIDHDKKIFDLYDSLKRYKDLMNSVSQTPCPDGLCDNINEQLERQILLADTNAYSHSAGRRHLIFRRLMTAAAMLALTAILSFVILDIFVPKSSRDKFFADTMRKKSLKETLYEKPFPDEDESAPQAVRQNIPITPVRGNDVPLVAVLTLETRNPIEVDWLVAKAMTTTGIFNQTTAIDRQPGSVKYVINCSNESAANLLAELSFLWPQCSNAKLDIGEEQAGKYITINNISTPQALEICKAEAYPVRIKLAGDIAAANRAAAENIEKIYAIDGIDYEQLYTQKPALASAEKSPDANLPTIGDRTAVITIIVVGK
ncbi:MAG: anti-sigma factor family protein [Sedimentisphaerales bacterium]